MTSEEIEALCERYRVISITSTRMHGGGWSVIVLMERSDPERAAGQPRILRASRPTLEEATTDALDNAGASRHATELALDREARKRQDATRKT